MLLVRDSMTREVMTLAPDETIGTALALCRERRIRHLPVLTEGRLVGIVSDRDLRSATPAFGDQERAAALQEILVEDVMASDVISILPDDPIEQAANTMRERHDLTGHRVSYKKHWIPPSLTALYSNGSPRVSVRLV
jgi:acetoin utilization protein AcuB